MTFVLLGLGTNLGDRQQNLAQAIAGLKQWLVITAVSPVYETAPWGVTDQPTFWNACVAGQSDYPPHDLLAACKRLEEAMGRRPTWRWGPRLIDIDLLFYGDVVLEERALVLPHPRLAERAFVLVPLADIAPDFSHPQTGLTVREMMARVETTTVSRLDVSLW